MAVYKNNTGCPNTHSHLWPGPCINVILGHFGENLSTSLHSNCGQLWVYMQTHLCPVHLFVPKQCSQLPQPAQHQVRSHSVLCWLLENSISGGWLEEACNAMSSLFINEKRVPINLYELSIKYIVGFFFFFPLQGSFCSDKNEILHTSKIKKHTSESPWVWGWGFSPFSCCYQPYNFLKAGKPK